MVTIWIILSLVCFVIKTTPKYKGEHYTKDYYKRTDTLELNTKT